MFAASVHLEVELITFAFVESREARTLDRADVHECVRLAVVTYKEAETLHCIEEFDGPGRFFSGQFTLRSCTAIAAAFGVAASALFDRNDIADNLDVLRRHLAAAIDQIEFEALTFSQTFEAGALNRTDVNENVFAAAFLLDEAEALLSVEELYDAFAGADDLCGHAVETAGTATTAALAAAEPSAAATGTAATAASAEAITAAAAAAEAVIAATETVAAAAIAVTAEIAAATERIEAFFTESIALITAPTTAPFIITHNLKRTFVSPPDIHFAGNASGSAPNSSGEKTRSPQPPINHYT